MGDASKYIQALHDFIVGVSTARSVLFTAQRSTALTE